MLKRAQYIMQEFSTNNDIYINIKDIFAKRKDFCKGIRSYSQFLTRKNIKDYVYGQIVNDEFVITEKYSKKLGSIFINKNELPELFSKPQEVLPPAPPVIEDKDLIFFKDDEGKEYRVTMRGTRTKDSIYFKVKDVMRVFNNVNIQKQLLDPRSSYKSLEDYKFFDMTKVGKPENEQVKEMYLTYNGLMNTINVSRSGVGYKFKNWIDEVVFSAAWGTQDQKVETFKKVLNVDADHLKAIMNKSAFNISCLYLIDVKINDTSKKVFKYGFTDNVHRRFKQHMKHYGDNISLDTFILVPVLDLSKAESDFKNSISRYQFFKDGEQELVSLCNEAYINVKTIFRTISDKYCGNMKNQIAVYEHEIKDLNHSYELKLRDKDIKIAELQGELQLKDSHLTIKDRDIEILQLRLELLQQKK